MKPLKFAMTGLILAALAAVGLLFSSAGNPMAWAAEKVEGAITAKASGTVTTKRFVKLTAAGTVAASTASTDKVVGVCEQTALTTTITKYAPPGTQTTVTAGEDIAVGDLLVSGTSGKAYVARGTPCVAERIAALALTAGDATTTTDVTCIVLASREGTGQTATAVDASTTILAAATGKVYAVSATATITLPVPTADTHYLFYVAADDGTCQITLSPTAVDCITGMGLTGVTNKDLINTLATSKRGDWVAISGDGTSTWRVQGQQGTWAAEP